MKIHVTKEDIENGVPNNETGCPVVLALKRETGCEWDVDYETAVKLTGYTEAEGFDCDDYTSYLVVDLPEHITEFINRFDKAEGVIDPEPFEFELEVEKYFEV